MIPFNVSKISIVVLLFVIVIAISNLFDFDEAIFDFKLVGNLESSPSSPEEPKITPLSKAIRGLPHSDKLSFISCQF